MNKKSTQSRRVFLENSLLASASAAAAAAANMPISVYAEQEADKPSTSAAERLSAAVIGVKGRGRNHIGELLKRRDVEITYICDADEKIGQDRCNEIEKKTKRRPKFVRDMRRVFDDPHVDIITTATPNHWHALCAIWAIQAGKDVYVEKPVSHNVSEGRRIVEAARKYGKICQTGTQCRSTGGTNKGIEYVHNGRVGTLKVARGFCYKRRGSIGAEGQYDPPASVDYNLWCGPAPLDPLTRPRLHYDWHWAWSTGNGDLGNQGIHQMDLARWALGVPGLGRSVFAYGGRLGYQDAGETANTQVSVHDFGDKLLVFEVRGLNTKKFHDVGVGNIFECTDGYVVLTSYTKGYVADKNWNVLEKFGGGGDHFGNFLKAVRSRRAQDLNADIEEGHLSSALCHLGNISLRLGQATPAAAAAERLETLPSGQKSLDVYQRFLSHLADNRLKPEETQISLGPILTLEGETFVGEQAELANRMLTREYRQPFVVPEKV